MAEEQIRQKFKEAYPDCMRGDVPLSPYFDIWEYAIEITTEELQSQLAKKDKQIEELYSNHCGHCNRNKLNSDLQKQLTKAKKIIRELMSTSSQPFKYLSVVAEAQAFLKE